MSGVCGKSEDSHYCFCKFDCRPSFVYEVKCDVIPKSHVGNARIMHGFRSVGACNAYLGLFSAPQSLGRITAETLSPSHPHSSKPRHGLGKPLQG